MRLNFTVAIGAGLLAGAPAHAEAGDWLVRVRGVLVAPTETSGSIQPSVPTGRVGVSNSIAPELDFTYMVGKRIGAELILGTTKHHVSGRGSLNGAGRLARTWVLPPTLTLQYHLAPDARVRPYVGAGINYTLFYSERASGAMNAAFGPTKVQLKDSFGYALQAGVDIDLTERVFANLDIKYVDIDTTARLTSGTTLNQVGVSIDPLIVGVGLGIRF